jgi:hypothetical protein
MAMAKVFMINLSLSEIFGMEYSTPIKAMIDVNKIPSMLLIKIGIDIPIKFMDMTNINACLFDTFPEGIGRLVFPFTRSRSASIRSLSTYMPVIISKVDIGRSTVFEIRIMPSSDHE